MAAGRAFVSSLVLSVQLFLLHGLLRSTSRRKAHGAPFADEALPPCGAGDGRGASRAPLKASPREIAEVAKAFLSQEEGGSRP